MENDYNLRQAQAFYRILEDAVGSLPADVRGRLYRPAAENCVKGAVLTELRRQFEECGCDLDRQYAKYGRSEYFFADVIEPGRVYEIGYPRCLCPQVEAGFVEAPTHCECSRQSILCVYRELIPGKSVRVDMTGGTLTIDVERDSAGHVTDLFLTGPTNIVCKGEITDEALDSSLLSKYVSNMLYNRR